MRLQTEHDRDHEIVACDFPLQIDASRDPAHDRMQHEQSFKHSLRDQSVIVTTGEMCGFMQADLIDLGGIEF